MFKNAINIINHKGLIEFIFSVYYLLKINFYIRIFQKNFIKKKIRGSWMYLNAKDRGISRTLLLFGKREEEHKIILENVLRPGMNILDIGANIGYYALMEHRNIGGKGQIIAVEPSPENVELLKKNLALNDCRNVLVLEAGVSNEKGRRNLYMSELSNLHSFHDNLVKEKDNYNSRSINVEMIAIQEINFAGNPPDLIRMDVEGHEVEILSGILEVAKASDKGPMILFETHHNKYNSEHDISVPLKGLFEMGYHGRYIGSSSRRGTNIIEELGYKGSEEIETDFMHRVIYENISNEDLIHLVCRSGGVRTVLLAKQQGPSLN